MASNALTAKQSSLIFTLTKRTAGRDPHHLHGGADHVGGALLAFRSFGHYRLPPGEGIKVWRYALGPVFGLRLQNLCPTAGSAAIYILNNGIVFHAALSSYACHALSIASHSSLLLVAKHRIGSAAGLRQGVSEMEIFKLRHYPLAAILAMDRGRAVFVAGYPL
jgi:hypothetical protein